CGRFRSRCGTNTCPRETSTADVSGESSTPQEAPARAPSVFAAVIPPAGDDTTRRHNSAVPAAARESGAGEEQGEELLFITPRRTCAPALSRAGIRAARSRPSAQPV